VSSRVSSTLIATWLLAAATVALAEEVEDRRLHMFVGDQDTLPAEGVRSYSEGTPGIVDVRLPRTGDQFVLVALKPGVTQLLLVLRDNRQVRYTITVAPPEPYGSVQPRDNIRLDFYFVQLTRSEGYQIGLAWPGTIGGTVGTQATWNLQSGSLIEATASVAGEVLPRLDLAQASGWARVLRQATVVTANGETASFRSGGEVNVPITSGTAANLEKVEFGSEVKIEPRYDRHSGRIEIKVTADISDLAPGLGAVPGRNVSRIETLVNLELGQSLILGGLSARAEESSRNGLPLFGQIPIVGILFGSHGKRSQETENVVFIVPTVVEAVPLEMRDRVAEAYRVYEAFSGDIRARLVPPTHVPRKPSRSARDPKESEE
jgi:pilus assembly protein CpaC